VYWAAGGFDDFRGEMWLGVHEGAFLFELPGGSILHTAHGVERRGPWPPEECSRCLLTWFDRGWIDAFALAEHLDYWAHDDPALLRDPDDHAARIIERGRARAILADPQMWTNDRAEGFVVPSPTTRAPSSDFRQLWLDVVEPPE
jgi:hypothetical protein